MGVFCVQVAQGFKCGCESVEDEQRAGRPSAARTENNVTRVKAVLDRDRRLNVRLIAEEVGLQKTDVHRIRGETADKWFLHHDITPSHTSFAVREFFKQNYITTLPHPPYSPDLAPCDFFLFPKLKTHLK